MTPHATILHIDDCPGRAGAGDALRAALDATGHTDAVVTFDVIRTSEQAAAVPFSGSPTILIDDEDLFPGTRSRELACRVYPTPAGLRPAPTVQQIIDALAALPQ